MSKALSFWAALAAIESLLQDTDEAVYLWTLTGASAEVRQNRPVLMRAWNRLMKTRGFRDLDVSGYRATEQGSRGEQGWHMHFVTQKWISVDRMRELSSRVGFGRINVKVLPRSAAGYAAKYLTKTDATKGQRRWASFGRAAKVRCSDIEIYDQFRRYAVEPRQAFPSEGSAQYWWAECLRGLVAAFLRQPYDQAPPKWDSSLIDRYRGLEGFSEALCRAMFRVMRPKTEAVVVDGVSEWGLGCPAKIIHPRWGVYVGRWVPEFTVTDKSTGRTWARRQARHLVLIGGVYWWIREPGTAPIERPARPGDLVLIAFLWDQKVAEQKICGEAVGYVVALVARAEAASEPDAKKAEQVPCASNPGHATLFEQEQAVAWLEALGTEKNGQGDLVLRHHQPMDE